VLSISSHYFLDCAVVVVVAAVEIVVPLPFEDAVVVSSNL
jgi:hypothetical protein